MFLSIFFLFVSAQLSKVREIFTLILVIFNLCGTKLCQLPLFDFQLFQMVNVIGNMPSLLKQFSLYLIL